MFQILDLEEDDAVDLLHRLLEQGIPSSAIARALHIDHDFVRGLAAEVRSRRYGTSEITEAMDWLMWQAFDVAVDLLHTGSPANRIRAVSMILPRSVTAAAKQDPQAFGQVREALQDLLQQQTEVPLLTEDEPGEFVVG
jgi:orotate phosphoribosyltransferase-like protein